jgi:hypothetical protein
MIAPPLTLRMMVASEGRRGMPVLSSCRPLSAALENLPCQSDRHHCRAAVRRAALPCQYDGHAQHCRDHPDPPLRNSSGGTPFLPFPRSVMQFATHRREPKKTPVRLISPALPSGGGVGTHRKRSGGTGAGGGSGRTGSAIHLAEALRIGVTIPPADAAFSNRWPRRSAARPCSRPRARAPS